MTEEQKPLSKKELKRLAKKATKDGTKNEKPSTETSTKNATSTQPPIISNELMYFLANASKDCDASRKAAIASILFNVKLLRAPPSLISTIPTFFKGPTLLTSSASSVAFGGNGITKALSLVASNPNDSVMVEEWLELERTALRSSCTAKGRKAALALVENSLRNGSGRYLVSDSLTIADIAIVVTLSNQKGAVSDVIQTYLDMHNSSPAFTEGSALLDALVPPPPVDVSTNPSLILVVNSVIHKAITSIVPLGVTVPDIVVEKCKQLKFGDYQCKEAMPIFAQMKASGTLPPGVQSQSELAQSIVNQIPVDNPVVDSLKVNGPGFILCKIKASHLQQHINKMMNSANIGQEPKVPIPTDLQGRDDVVVVDFSSPNIAKEMHVGHLRSTIIGESVCRILEFAGSDVKRVNHVGDWGTQFGMLITYLKESCPDFGDGKSDNVNIGDLTQFYKNAKARFDEDSEFKKTSQLNVVKLQSGDEECKGIWQLLCDISRLEFEKVYKRLDITVKECGESFYNDKIAQVIEEFDKAGHISVEEGGAKCVFVPKFRIPLMLQKSDGGFGYDSTDMTAMKYRLSNLNASRIVYITDFSQGDHFKMCFAAAEKIGWLDAKKHQLEHIGFGTVMGEDGKRFKTRSGDTVRLVDLLDEAVSRMEKSLHERIEAGKANISSEEVPEVAASMGYGAVKYFDLHRNPKSNYQFSYDKMLDTNGNTAVYLLYAHARLESICTKGLAEHNIDVNEIVKKKDVNILLGQAAERNLALHMLMFADMIEEVLKDLYPSRICEFLYSLSVAVSTFLNSCYVLNTPEMESRLLLCHSSAIVMRQCFDLLAIRHVKSI